MKLLTLLLLFSLWSAASAQTSLRLGTPIERELELGQLHQFMVHFEENYFGQIVVNQRGVDVIVRVFSPSGKKVGEFDSPTGTDGPEEASFVAVEAGTYLVTVAHLDPTVTNTGRYEIKLVEVRKATEQELRTSKNVEVTKAKGVALLADIEALIPQVKSAHTRLKMQLQAAQLLWDIDQKRASILFADATATMKEYIASVHPDDLHLFQHTIGQLRLDIVQALAPRDPDAALNFLRSTSQTISSAFDKRDYFSQESALELAVADQIMRNNPKRALQLARQTLERGYPLNLVNTLSELRRQDPQLGAELANEITAKLIDEKLLSNTDAAYLAASLVRHLSSFTVSKEPTNGTSPPPFLPEDRVKDLIQKVFDEAMAYSKPVRPSHNPANDAIWNIFNALKSIAPKLDTIIPGGTAAVDKKLAELSNYGSSYGATLTRRMEELSLESIAKMPVEVREQQYMQLAYNESQKGNPSRARQIINELVTTPSQRRQAFSQLDQQEMYQAMNNGHIDQLLRILSGFRNSRERAQHLSQLPNHIGPGLKRSAALNLLEQARSLLGPSVEAQSQQEMQALLEIARAFSRYDVKRSFEIIDPLIEQFNAMSVAARTLNGFGQDYYYDDDEMDLQNGNPVAIVLSSISSVLGTTAMIDFDRTKATADRIRSPEARLKVYLDIAQQTIQDAK